MVDTIDVMEFAQIANVKISTIKKNAKRIPGLSYKNGTFEILKGTRYPGDFHRYKMKDTAQKRYILLKAISENKYIDHLKLHLYEEQFIDLLRELMDANLIKENHLFNQFGANAYDCTGQGDALLLQERFKAIKELANIVASSAGHFIGAIITEVHS